MSEVANARFLFPIPPPMPVPMFVRGLDVYDHTGFPCGICLAEPTIEHGSIQRLRVTRAVSPAHPEHGNPALDWNLAQGWFLSTRDDLSRYRAVAWLNLYLWGTVSSSGPVFRAHGQRCRTTCADPTHRDGWSSWTLDAKVHAGKEAIPLSGGIVIPHSDEKLPDGSSVDIALVLAQALRDVITPDPRTRV